MEKITSAHAARALRYLPSLLIMLLPVATHALTLAETREYLSIGLRGMIGAFGGIAIIVFIAGFIVYLTRWATDHRVEGIAYMVKGFQILVAVFILICILVLVE